MDACSGCCRLGILGFVPGLDVDSHVHYAMRPNASECGSARVAIAYPDWGAVCRRSCGLEGLTGSSRSGYQARRGDALCSVNSLPHLVCLWCRLPVRDLSHGVWSDTRLMYSRT